MKLQDKINDLRSEIESVVWRKAIVSGPIKVQSEDLKGLNPDGATELMARAGALYVKIADEWEYFSMLSFDEMYAIARVLDFQCLEFERTIKFRIGEISKEEMTWEEAKAYAEKQEMRLPTRIELLVMIEQGVKLPECCWTCVQYSAAYAWYVGPDGVASITNKYNGLYAVPVQKIA